MTEDLGLQLLAGAGQVGLQVLPLLLPEVGLLLPAGEVGGQLLVLPLQLLRPPPALQQLFLLRQPAGNLDA